MSSISRPVKKIGQYQIGDLLGRGSIGTVYKGLHQVNGSNVAIKQVSIQSIRAEQYKALEQEINLLKKLRHVNIVKYIDCVETEGFLNIILEYIESGSLASIIKKFGPFSEQLVAIYVKQVLFGLDYLHAQGVVHRDIKGANILTTKEGVVKLADFGVATRLTDDEQSFTLVGTPYWMAPEIIEMRGHISTAQDIWSLGCTVIELLTGNPPYFDLMQYPALFRIVQDDCPPIPEGISENCRDFLIKCFQKDPAQRMDAKGLLKHNWIMQNQPNTILLQSPQLPEEVNNTIRMHIDSQQTLRTEQVLEQNLQAASGVQSNFGTILDEGSFISVDGGNNYQKSSNMPPLVQCQSPKQEKKGYSNSSERSSQIRDSQMDSLRQLKIRRSQQQAGLVYNRLFASSQQGVWGPNEDGKAIRELNEIVQNMRNTEQTFQIIKNLMMVKQLIENHEKIKEYIVNQIGLTCFLHLIEIYLPKFCQSQDDDSAQIIYQVMQLINQIVDNSQAMHEIACLFGALQYAITMSSSDFPKDIRIESAYFIGQMVCSSHQQLLILISIGGLDALIELLDIDIQNNQDLIFLSLDSLSIIFQQSILSKMYLNLCRIIISKNEKAIHKLVHLIEQLFIITFINNQITTSQEQSNLSIKIQQYSKLKQALELVNIFSQCDDKLIQQSICQDEVLKTLASFIVKFNIDESKTAQIINKVVKIFRYLAKEPTLILHFENLGLIPNCIKLLDKNLTECVNCIKSNIPQDQIYNYTKRPNFNYIFEFIKLIVPLTKLNPLRQEEFAFNNGISLLLSLCQIISLYLKSSIIEESQVELFVQMKKAAQIVLISMVYASQKTREKIWDNKGIGIYIDFLNEQLLNSQVQGNDQVIYLNSLYIRRTMLSDLVSQSFQMQSQSQLRQKMKVNALLNNQQTKKHQMYQFTALNQQTNQHFNQQSQFISNNSQHHIFSKLTQINPQFASKLSNSAQFCQSLSDYLQQTNQVQFTPLTIKQLLNILYQLLLQTPSPIQFLKKYNLLVVCERLRGKVGQMENGIAVQDIAEMIGIIIEKEGRKSRKQQEDLISNKISPSNQQRSFKAYSMQSNLPNQ